VQYHPENWPRVCWNGANPIPFCAVYGRPKCRPLQSHLGSPLVVVPLLVLWTQVVVECSELQVQGQGQSTNLHFDQCETTIGTSFERPSSSRDASLAKTVKEPDDDEFKPNNWVRGHECIKIVMLGDEKRIKAAEMYSRKSSRDPPPTIVCCDFRDMYSITGVCGMTRIRLASGQDSFARVSSWGLAMQQCTCMEIEVIFSTIRVGHHQIVHHSSTPLSYVKETFPH
jgi:hypothetical protein